MVALRGTRDGLRIQLGEGEWASVLSDLTTQLDRPQAKSFFRGALVSIDAGRRVLSGAQIQTLGELLTEREMMLMVLTGSAAETRALAAELNLLPAAPVPVPVPLPEPPPVEVEPLSEVPDPAIARAFAVPRLDPTEMPALLVRRTVRSGQVVRFAQHIVVYGDVNPGGEVIAGGDIIVWGKLRGAVHAGAFGDEQAVVGALYLAPTRLRIGNLIARAPDEKKKRTPSAEIARIRNERIVVESWTGGK